MLKQILRYFKARNTLAQLSKLSDRELKDIGIGRSDIYRVAQSTYEK